MGVFVFHDNNCFQFFFEPIDWAIRRALSGNPPTGLFVYSCCYELSHLKENFNAGLAFSSEFRAASTFAFNSPSSLLFWQQGSEGQTFKLSSPLLVNSPQSIKDRLAAVNTRSFSVLGAAHYVRFILLITIVLILTERAALLRASSSSVRRLIELLLYSVVLSRRLALCSDTRASFANFFQTRAPTFTNQFEGYRSTRLDLSKRNPKVPKKIPFLLD